MILHIPHASSVIPEALRDDFCLGDAELRQELVIMTDWFTDEIFMPAMQRGDQAVRFPMSRLVVDPERFLDDRAEPMAARGMGAVYTSTHDGRPLRNRHPRDAREWLIAEYYEPHHERLTRAVEAELEGYGRAIVIDCHSFPARPLPFELDQSFGRPDICIGTDGFHTPAWLAETVCTDFRDLGFTVAVNAPFSGALLPMAHYRRAKEVLAVMIEINRRTYMDEAAVKKTDRFASVSEAVAHVLQEVRDAAELADGAHFTST